MAQRHLSTSEFAQAIGISESSVRRMADAGELTMYRTQGGHRRIPVAEALRYVRATKTKIVRPDILGLTSEARIDLTESDSDRLRRALEQGNSPAVIGLLQGMYAGGKSFAEICDGPIRTSMATIGSYWPTNKRAIFLEHRATLVCVRALHQLWLSIPTPDASAPRAIGGAPTGDPYLLPSLTIALALYELGMNETCLGPNTPLDVLADAIETEKPALTWLSISTPIHSRTQIHEIERLAEIAHDSGSTFILGGRYATGLIFANPALIRRHDTIAELADIVRPILARSSSVADEDKFEA